MSDALLVLVLLPPAVGVSLLTAGRRADRAAAPVAVTVMLAVAGLALTVASGRPAVRVPFLAGMPAELSVDGLSAVLCLTVTAVTLLVLAHSAVEFGRDESRSRFFGLMLLFAGSMLLTVTAATLPVLLMGWEVMGATSWALIGFRWRDPERTEAANTAFLTTRTADLGLYLAAGAALAADPTGTLALRDLPGAGEPWRSVMTAGMITAALGKSAQLPFSFWLSRAMAGPSPVSALLHSAAMVVAGAYLLLRVHPLLEASAWGVPVVAWAGALTAVVLGLVALAQTDLKQLLAASSCAQIGFMVLAAGTGAPTGGALQLVAHAAAKSLLFLIAGAWLTALGTRTLTGLSGAARRYPAVGALFTVGALTLAGLPPLPLWGAKDLVLASVFEASPALYAAGLAAAMVSALYSVKALWFVWQPVPTTAGGRGDGHSGTRRVPGRALPPLAVLASACVASSVLAFDPARAAFTRVLGSAPQPAPNTWELVAGAVLVVGAAGLAWAWGRRWAALPATAGAAFLGRWLRLEDAARLAVTGPVLAAARAAARFDDRVLDRAVRGAGRGAYELARWTDRRLETALTSAVSAVASACRSLGRAARRPQTGQLHQYLAQAVAAFTVLALVFLLVK
ncbi:NADH-quinone oxidoreductase subunit 5 family protein [Streptomyces griseus]|uniref:NADH-quinone oxidoreductase subunit 5 family protein n=1 Tax=Streptomyces griseus TaxID=1911 RepID=UPI00083FE2A1|nr:proton-conducting transporter membrane subunit [Streptomyces griseus]